ncbi:zinc-binding protein A33-like [Rhinoraja longicauda]
MMETLGSSGRRPSSQTKADIDGEIHQLLLRACTKFGRLRRRVFDERISKVPQISVNAALGMRSTGSDPDWRIWSISLHQTQGMNREASGRVSRALARLAEKARTLSLNRTEKESKLLCEEHQEELKLFCETDKKLICVICAGGREHREHCFMLVDEAAKNYKGQVKASIQSLTKDKSEIQQMEQQQKEKISGVLEQSQNLQSKITSQFAELHQILTENEQRVLADIREEEKKILNTMEKKLEEIEENLNSIQEELFKLQQQMDQKDSMVFLKEEAGRKRRVGDEAKPQSVVDGNLMIEKFETPFLYNTVLAETSDAIKQVSVTLDVETAGPVLEVSEDRKRIRWTETRRSLPDTGEEVYRQ